MKEHDVTLSELVDEYVEHYGEAALAKYILDRRRFRLAHEGVLKFHAPLFGALADGDAREDLRAARRALVTFMAYRR